MLLLSRSIIGGEWRICSKRRGKGAVRFSFHSAIQRSCFMAHRSTWTCKRVLFIIPLVSAQMAGLHSCHEIESLFVSSSPVNPTVSNVLGIWFLFCFVFSSVMKAGCPWRALASSMTSVRRPGRLWNPISCWTQPCIFPIHTWSVEQPCLVGFQNLSLSPSSQNATGKRTITAKLYYCDALEWEFMRTPDF